MGKLTFGATGLSYQVEKVTINTGGAPLCPCCGDRVYFNEERRALGKVWHIKCFNCAKCKKKLDSTTVAAHENEIYCMYCHKKEFGPKGYGFAGGAAGLAASTSADRSPQGTGSPSRVSPMPEMMASAQALQADAPIPAALFNDSERCPRCLKKVYFAEEVKALGKKFHRLCFKCGNCNKMLEPGRCSTHEKELYCNNCYGRKYGPKGYGFAGGAGTLLAADEKLNNLRPKQENVGRDLETISRKADPISSQQQELLDRRPSSLVNGVYYGASNSIFDSRRDSTGRKSYTEINASTKRTETPVVQDEPKVVLVPHERTRFSPSQEQEQRSWSQEEPRTSPYSQEQPRTSPYSQEQPRTSPYSQEQPRTSPYSQEQPRTSPYSQEQPRLSPYSQEQPRMGAYSQEQPSTSPYSQEQRSSPNNQRSPYGQRTSPSEQRNSPAYVQQSALSDGTGSIEELSRYNDPHYTEPDRAQSFRSPESGVASNPSPIDHLVTNMYTKSQNQQTGYAYQSGDVTRPQTQDRQYRSVEDLTSSDGTASLKVPQFHAKSASMDGISAYENVGSQQAVASALSAAHAEYGHVRATPAYVNPTIPASQQQPYAGYSQYNAGPYYPAPHNTLGYEGYDRPSVETARSPGHHLAYGQPAYSYDQRYQGSRQPDENFSSAVDAIFSRTMPKAT